MRYLSVCSGIEAASTAWHPLGWTPAGFSEIEPFPRAVLEQRFGAVAVDWDHRHTPQSNVLPLFGDFTKIEAHHVGPVDLLVGGTPCQSFSVAGKRLGLDDPRGNLTLEFLALARRLRPRWLLWENVPGILSDDKGRTLGTFLGLVGQLGYSGCYRVLDAQFVRVDGFGRAVPQRRRRVFFVGHLGADARAFPVLFERESLSGHPAPRREAGQSPAPTLAARTRGGGGLGTDFDCDGGLVCREVSPALKARDYKGVSSDGDGDGAPLVAHSLRADGFDASEDGMGRGTPLVPVMAFSSKDHGGDASEISPTLRSMGHDGSHANGGGQVAIAIQERAVCENTEAGPGGAGFNADGAAYTLEARHHVQAVAFAQNSRDEVRLFNGDGSTAGALAAEPGMKQQSYVAQPFSIIPMNSGKDFKARETDVSQPIMAGGPGLGNQGGDYIAKTWAVRRLTPRECERLQGFPDDWTLITYRGKPASDGPRYKAIGNSMAGNVMRWIGTRIAWADEIAEAAKGEAAA